MNIERLTKLRQLVAASPEGQINLNLWVQYAGGCGAIACILGTACLDREFNKAGLLFGAGGAPEYGEYEGTQAGQEFFGLDYWNELFAGRTGAERARGLPDRTLALARLDFLLAHGEQTFIKRMTKVGHCIVGKYRF